jgi:ubiquinone biosynthesis protein
VSVLKTLVSSSRALVTGAKDVGRFREIASVFIRHGFGWVFAQFKLRRELQVDYEGANLTRAALASPDTGKRLVAALTELGPTFVKLGQILSTRTDLLPASIIEELSTLQDNVDPLPFEEMDLQLRRSLGPDYRDRFTSVDETCLASASIAQVHRAKLEDGADVVLKIQRPDIRGKIESDIHILFAIAGYAEEAIDEARVMNLPGVINDFAKSIFQELDFGIEARNLERFQRNFKDNPKIVIPAVHRSLSTAEVLCMEYIDGRKFSELIEEGSDVDAIVENYFNAAYQMLFKDGFFHSDLHPGNVLVLKGGSLGLLDCGMVGRLSPSMKDKTIDILHAILSEDLEALARTFYALAIHTGRVDYQAFEADVMEISDRYLSGLPLSEIQIGTLIGEIVGGASRHKIRMPTDFTMLFKAMLTTEGLARSMAPDVDPIELARPFIVEMIAERYNVDRLKSQAMADLHGLLRLVRALPQSVPAVLNDIQDGKLAFAIAPATLETQRRHADARARRIIKAALATSLLLCGTYTLGLELPIWGTLGIPYVSAALLTAAALGFLELIVR